MGLFQVSYAPQAKRDLQGIVRYIARDNRDAAIRFGDVLAEKAISLKHPHVRNMGTELPEKPGVKKLIHRNYLILYWVFEDQKKVRILRFWHGARDLEELELD